MRKFTIEKKYHFYAAHRNQNLEGKCRNIHGHTYDVVAHFEFEQKDKEVTMEFGKIDELVEPMIKRFDHAFIIDSNDHLYKYLLDFNEEFKFLVLKRETSLENLAKEIFYCIEFTTLPIVKLELSETKSSKVIYNPKYDTNI